MKQTLYDYCIENSRQDLLVEWNDEKNTGISRHDVSYGSQRKVWWRCSKGHEWESTIQSRIHGRGCPVCVGHMVIEGENDLKTHFPNIAAHWNYEKNGSLKPEHVTPYSNKKVWWRCALGHTYSASIVARTYQGIGCSYCSGHKVLPGFNDLKTKCPEVANQWHDKLNGQLTPENVTHGSGKEAWWKCSLGHVWKAKIVSRTCRYSGCPVCAGRKNSPYYGIDYEALEKEILSEQSKD